MARIILLNYLRNNLILKFIKFILASKREFKKLTMLIYFIQKKIRLAVVPNLTVLPLILNFPPPPKCKASLLAKD